MAAASVRGKLGGRSRAEPESAVEQFVPLGQVLRRYSLVSPSGDGLVLVHRLVQAITAGSRFQAGVRAGELGLAH